MEYLAFPVRFCHALTHTEPRTTPAIRRQTMWKTNWEETKQHFCDWWSRRGLVLGMWGAPGSDACMHENVPRPPSPGSLREAHVNADLRAQRNHYELARRAFPADTLPISDTGIGPGSLALLLGSEPGFSDETVWFEPCIHECSRPEELPPFKFDEGNQWWITTEKTLVACAKLARGKYVVGCPDLIENIDILAALRGPQLLMTDMIERPGWIEEKMPEINQVWFEAYQRTYDIIKQDDGGAAFGAFSLWGPGKTAKVQCDASAMFSPAMFQRFVVPSLTEQCEWLDYSMYHLDGTQAICHLDALLGIDALDAIEWTPQSGLEDGGHPRWFDLYHRILDAGKAVQIVGVGKKEIVPVLDAVGSSGVYIMTSFSSSAEAEEIAAMVEPYR